MRLAESISSVLNGACDNGWCYSPNGSERYHVSTSSASFDDSSDAFLAFSHSESATLAHHTSIRYSILLDIVPQRKVLPIPDIRMCAINPILVGQLPQTSYHALQTPYSFFGLGRTNNYIENLFVGSTVHIDEHYINMEGVIPNSKVVILPSANEGEAWKRELFLRPGQWIPWVTVTVVAGTLVLAVIVFVLHLNEKACLSAFPNTFCSCDLQRS